MLARPDFFVNRNYPPSQGNALSQLQTLSFQRSNRRRGSASPPFVGRVNHPAARGCTATLAPRQQTIATSPALVARPPSSPARARRRPTLVAGPRLPPAPCRWRPAVVAGPRLSPARGFSGLFQWLSPARGPGHFRPACTSACLKLWAQPRCPTGVAAHRLAYNNLKIFKYPTFSQSMPSQKTC